MGENFIHIDNIFENRSAQRGGADFSSYVSIHLDGVSEIAIVSILSSLLTDLGIDLQKISRYRRICEEVKDEA